jgi:hypothetical protein
MCSEVSRGPYIATISSCDASGARAQSEIASVARNEEVVMNYRIARMMLMATAIVMLAIPGLAQSGVVSSSIPFEFTVADKTLPAGDYSIICDLSHQMVDIESRQNDGRNAIRLASLIEDKAGVTSPRLVFNQREGRYFLAQVWTGGSMGSQLAPGQIEVELAKSTNNNNVTIAAK